MCTFKEKQDSCSSWSLVSRVPDLLSVMVTDMFFKQLPLPCQACQEMLAERYGATCDTTAVTALTSLSPGQEVTQVKFM